MRDESVNKIKLNSEQKSISSNGEVLNESDTNAVFKESIPKNSGEKPKQSKTDILSKMDGKMPVAEYSKENGSIDIGFADEMIVKALSIRKKKQNSESGVKLRRIEKSSGLDETNSAQSQIFTERPFFQRLTDSIYRRLIIGSSNQIKLVGLISAARLLVHLYESNTLEIPQNEEVQYRIPLLNCHVGDWQPVDSDKVVLSKSSISKDILGCSKAPHAPPLVNRTRNIYIVTPLNYDGNKVGGGYRGGGSDPLSRLVMKWRNLSVSDIQDFTYITENGFDLKYNGFYILYAKSNKPDSQWKQFYSARMRTNAFNSRHQILINSTHFSKLIKLHTVHLQKDGTDLPIGMALFEDHTESLTTEDIRKDYSFQSSMNDLNNISNSSNEHKYPKGIEKNSKTTPETKNDINHLLETSKDTEFKKFFQAYPGLISYQNQILKQINKDTPVFTCPENGKVVGNLSNQEIINNGNVITSGQAQDQNNIFSQSQITGSNINSNFAKDSLELSLLFNFRSLNPKLQTEILHAISCIKFLNQDMFSAALRSALDAACVHNGSLSENQLVSTKGFGFMQPFPNTQNVFDKTKNELPLFIRLLQDNNTENVLNSSCNSIQESFIPSNETNKPSFTGYGGIDTTNFGFPSNLSNALFPIFWSSFLATQQFNNTNSFIAEKNSSKTNTFNLNKSSVTPDSNISDMDNQNDIQTSAISTPICKPIEK
ncbi:uncharacterized protein cubi_02243 [Cryptosporidium ubiquitum]|uniref:Uncharacterized protein n=1 Tax=Cryptosporidium ubiquitum TaxID=857276 RepID=A0A1J4MJ03_9CRYT|nr:uncharacterized protein cubi_02243 [Cryptosporidium ubiquitum]OII73012.1 hypothetical protein cubi_02243 [Cryptosporidium ubiquitum]